jgi:uncharacterized protein (DUF302 family)
MDYYFSRVLSGVSFEDAIERVKTELQKEGFGVLSEIDVKETLKKKIDVDFKKYLILGACNPHLAYQALKTEDKIGLMLPCNIVVEEHEDSTVEVSAIDPVPAMGSLNNHELAAVAAMAQSKLQAVVDNM